MRTSQSVGPRRSIRSVIAVLAALMLLAAACGNDDNGDAADDTTTTTAAPGDTTEPTDNGDDEWQQVVDAAHEEGRVVLYLALAGFPDRILEPWQEAYPDIELEILREGTGALTTKLEQERDLNQPEGDVTIHSSRAWMDENADSFTALDVLPNAGLWQDTRHWYDTYFTSLLLAFNVGYNPNVIEEVGAQPITDWDDLLQPELDGLLGLTRPDVSPVYLQHFWLLDEELGSEFTEALAGQNVRLYDSAGPLSQAVASGELAAGINLTPVQSGLLKDEGAPVEIVETADPAYTIGYWAAQMEWAQNPNAAALFMNWLMSPEAQEAISDWGYSSSPMLEITSDYPLPDDVEIFDGILTPDQEAFLARWEGLFL